MPPRRRPIPLTRVKKKIVERRRIINSNGKREYKFRPVSPNEIARTIPLEWISAIVHGQRALDGKAEQLRREMNAASVEMAAHHGEKIIHLSNTGYHYIPGIGYKVLDRVNPTTNALVQIYYNPFNGKTFFHSTRRQSPGDLRTRKPKREPIRDH